LLSGKKYTVLYSVVHVIIWCLYLHLCRLRGVLASEGWRETWEKGESWAENMNHFHRKLAS